MTGSAGSDAGDDSTGSEIRGQLPRCDGYVTRILRARRRPRVQAAGPGESSDLILMRPYPGSRIHAAGTDEQRAGGEVGRWAATGPVADAVDDSAILYRVAGRRHAGSLGAERTRRRCSRLASDGPVSAPPHHATASVDRRGRRARRHDSAARHQAETLADARRAGRHQSGSTLDDKHSPAVKRIQGGACRGAWVGGWGAGGA